MHTETHTQLQIHTFTQTHTDHRDRGTCIQIHTLRNTHVEIHRNKHAELYIQATHSDTHMQGQI